MSFLNLRRLLPPKKVWKILTKKFQNLNRSRTNAIETPKTHSYKTFKKLSWPFLSIQRNKFKFKFKPKPHTLIHLNNLTPPVYVDRLLVDSLSTMNKHMHTPHAVFRKEANKKKLSSSTTYFKKRSSSYQKNYKHTNQKADDIWESPQTQGIDERADEFIAKFRAQMHQQEMQARRL